MKRLFSILGLTILLAIITNNAFSQVGPPPPPPGNPGSSSPGPVGGTAPIGKGSVLLVVLAVSYGIVKTLRKESFTKGKIN